MSQGLDASVNALLEDFRCHWAALLQHEAEVSRWSTIYSGALVLGAAGVLTEAAAATREPEVVLSSPIGATALLLLAAVNAVYIAALAFKGYQCQLLRLYLYEVLGVRLQVLADERFNSYEMWSRREFCAKGKHGKPEPVRVAYYALQPLLPLTTSAILLAFYYKYSVATSSSRASLAGLILVVLLTLVSAASALATSSTSSRWRELVARGTEPAGKQSDRDSAVSSTNVSSTRPSRDERIESDKAEASRAT